ncbi:hypothetical protein ACFYRN_42560 [Streptomyces sp. NPDC005227]|uniref:hypothetical protein n=1 Tax=Streptomyces sp. NPDC005227 TaxID=3364707 RepID=UPI0036C9B688
MARRDIEKVLSDLEGLRQLLGDPNVGLTALHQDQDAQQRKILEHVTYSTTGVREENRELRRRQEKMLGDLGDVRTAVDALRREIAQAWAHTLGYPHLGGAVPPPAGSHETQQEPPALEPRIQDSHSSDERKDNTRVSEETSPDATGGHEVGDPYRLEEKPPLGAHPADAAPVAAAAPPALPAVSDRPPGEAVEVSSGTERTVDPSYSAAAESPESGMSEDAGTDARAAAPPDVVQEREQEQRAHRDSLLAAAAVSSARLVCHKDTWAFLAEQTLRHAHFRLPDQITETDEGKIDTQLSGRSLLAVLVTTQQILSQPDQDDLATWALASAINRRTRAAVTSATLTRPDDSAITTIVLDDRPQPCDS